MFFRIRIPPRAKRPEKKPKTPYKCCLCHRRYEKYSHLFDHQVKRCKKRYVRAQWVVKIWITEENLIEKKTKKNFFFSFCLRVTQIMDIISNSSSKIQIRSRIALFHVKFLIISKSNLGKLLIEFDFSGITCLTIAT